MDEQRQALQDYYEGLAPEERRSRIILKPEFRDAYNELVEADRQFPVPQYLWERWVPVLGLFPVAVYLELRRMCFVNRATGERRDWCWPRQETIARRLGVRKRHTVGKALEVLESNGFITREPTYQKRGADAMVKRGVDRYLVYFEVPLVPADAAELLLRRTCEADGGGGSWRAGGEGAERRESGPKSEQTLDRAAKRPYRALVLGEPAPGPLDRAGKRPHAAGRETASRNVTRTMTSNVDNVGRNEGRKRLDRIAAEALALQIGESLSIWAGARDAGAHPSEGFHRLVASRLPEHLVREALMATRDAVERQRGGQGGCVRGPAAYFAGVVKNLAAENSVDLGLRSQTEYKTGSPTKATERSMAPRSTAGEAQSTGGLSMSVQESKAAVRALVENVQAKRVEIRGRGRA